MESETREWRAAGFNSVGPRLGAEVPMTLYGFKIHVSPDYPKMQLSERVKEVLSPACIAETNVWMLRFFGTTSLLGDGQVIVSEVGRFVTMNRRTYERFAAEVYRP